MPYTFWVVWWKTGRRRKNSSPWLFCSRIVFLCFIPSLFLLIFIENFSPLVVLCSMGVSFDTSTPNILHRTKRRATSNEADKVPTANYLLYCMPAQGGCGALFTNIIHRPLSPFLWTIMTCKQPYATVSTLYLKATPIWFHVSRIWWVHLSRIQQKIIN